MYFVYILFSKSLNKYYVGSSSNPEMRLTKHLESHKGFTAKAKDWKIVYKETFEEKTAAIRREKQIKNWKSRAMIIKLIEK